MTISNDNYAQPHALAEALALRAQGAWTPLAGGTDFYPARVGKVIFEKVLDCSRIAGWQDITETPTHWRIGANVTWTDLIRARLPSAFDALKQAAVEVGGVQIQNRGTLVGNICNASPAADGIPTLLAFDAEVEICAHTCGAGLVPLAAFVQGPRRTALASDALVTALLLPKPGITARSIFLKTGARKYLLISTVMVAAYIEGGASITRARIAVGACSAVAQRLPRLEAALIGSPINRTLGNLTTAQFLHDLSPISDVRSDHDYRIDAAVTLVRRALNSLGSMP